MNSIYRKHLVTVALVWAGCSALFLLVYILILAPQNKSKRQIEKELLEKKQTYSAALERTQEETKRRLNKEIEDLQDSLNEFVIDSEGSANLIIDISQIASNKELGSFRIGAKGKHARSDIPNCDYIGENHINISFAAGFKQFAGLVNALERHQPVVFVDEFIMTRSDKDSSGHQVDMDLAVFVRKQQEG
jgi:hypothetical protein